MDPCWLARRAHPEPAWISAARPEPACGKPRVQRNPSRRFAIRVLKSPSFLRRSSTLRMEWITVEWCLPPKLRPISGSDACVSDLQRYIGIWRGIATDFELLRDFSSAIFRL